MIAIAPRWLVYILCYDEPVEEGQRHYVGITSTDRLHARMLEHQNGHGAQFTISAFEQGISFELARVISAEHREAERLVQRPGMAERLCDRCAGRLTVSRYSAKDKPAADGPRRVVLSWY